MSKEWLAQLSAQAAQKGKVRYLMPTPPPRPQAAAAPAIDRQAAGRSFIGAIIGSVIRWAIFAAIAGGIAVFIISGQEELQDPLGEKVLYAIWYLASVAVAAMLPDMASAIDANAIYGALKPHAGAAALPGAAGVRRRRDGPVPAGDQCPAGGAPACVSSCFWPIWP